jgi:hypothetical protein
MHPAWFQHNKDYQKIIEAYLACNLNKKTLHSLLRQIYSEAISNTDMVKQTYKGVFETDYINSFIRKITDDKTALAIINASEERQPDKKQVSYYAEPDWAAKKEAIDAVLYPPPPKPNSDGELSDSQGNSTVAAKENQSSSTSSDNPHVNDIQINSTVRNNKNRTEPQPVQFHDAHRKKKENYSISVTILAIVIIISIIIGSFIWIKWKCSTKDQQEDTTPVTNTITELTRNSDLFSDDESQYDSHTSPTDSDFRMVLMTKNR